MYVVWNNTDNVQASFELYSEKDAERFCLEFRERFKTQGFYRTSDGFHIDPSDVELEIMDIDASSLA